MKNNVSLNTFYLYRKNTKKKLQFKIAFQAKFESCKNNCEKHRILKLAGMIKNIYLLFG